MSRHPGFPKPRDAGPVLEFFRYVRHGCFHGNRFKFKQSEPRSLAEWRGKVVTRDLEGKGTPIFQETTPVGEHFLEWGDALILIADACAKVYQPDEYAGTLKPDNEFHPS